MHTPQGGRPFSARLGISLWRNGIMAHLAWRNDLDIGIDVIDGQHRRIVEYINQLHDARQRRDKAAVGDVIDATVDYTLSHLEFEETLMEDAEYEFARAHKRVHELFVKRVAEFQRRFKAGEDVSDELHNLLARWLFSHIRKEDTGYVEAVRKNQVTLTKPPQGGWFSRSIGRLFPRA